MYQLPIQAYQDSVTTCPVCDEKLTSSKAVSPHFRFNHPDKNVHVERIEHDFAQDAADVLQTLHHDCLMPVQQISKAFGYPRDGLMECFDLLDVERRSWCLSEWIADNPELARENARKYGALGAAGREKNGMEGVTGQDHPRWSGGKSIYDAVKVSFRDESWSATRERIRERAGGVCESCGKEQPGRGLDVHHIIPVMCGGSNDDELLTALCITCHGKADAYTKSIPEVEPVLTE